MKSSTAIKPKFIIQNVLAARATVVLSIAHRRERLKKAKACDVLVASFSLLPLEGIHTCSYACGCLHVYMLETNSYMPFVL